MNGSTLFGSAPSLFNAGCCSSTATAPAAPVIPSNAPGLSAIQYRIGTFASFRRAMLDKVALPDLMAGGGAFTTLAQQVNPSDTTISVLDFNLFPATAPFRIKIGVEYLVVVAGAGTPLWTVTRNSPAQSYAVGDAVILDPVNPFARWHTGINADYQAMFIELWAYLADILTFYQERIANEAFITTATQQDSLLSLVSLINYIPSPGSAASGFAAFIVGKNTTVTIPAGFRVGSRAQPGKPAVAFETSSAITATGDNSTIPLSPLSPNVSFQPNTIVLQGVNNRLAVGDYVLAVENQGLANESPNLLQITQIAIDKNANITTISWDPNVSGYTAASKQVAVYAFRATAAPFGSNAPAWASLSPTLTTTSYISPNPPYPNNWDLPSFFFIFDRPVAGIREGVRDVQLDPQFFGREIKNPWFYIPTPNDSPNQLFLDAVYNSIPDGLGWVILLTDGNFSQILHLTEARQVSKAAYTLSANVTRLTFGQSETVIQNAFPLRSTTILTASERLITQNNLAVPDPVSGATLLLAGIHSQLRNGQTVIVQGNLFDSNANLPTQTSAAESAILNGAPVFDSADNLTEVTLKEPLNNSYVVATCSLLGNIVEITQGETIKDEVLGSGDGTQFQSYSLKQSPLTYLASTDPESGSAVQSTLLVTVNGVLWTEQATLVGSAPHDQVFTTTLDSTGKTTVVFGDGFNGARPASGINNIHARYRKGLGTSGNLTSGTVQQLVDSLPGVQKVTNPLPSMGGGDPDNVAQIRLRAPGSLRTFGRAISAPDYAALALSYPGIAKASAAWITRDPVTLVSLARPFVQLTVAAVDGSPIQGTVFASKLRLFLDEHRDPNIPLQIQDSASVPIQVAIAVDIDSHSPQHATLNQVQAALNPGLNPDGTFGFFAYDRLDFGQSIYLSALYAVLQAIPGVDDVTITTLRRTGEPPSTAPHDIVIQPAQIVVIDQTPGSFSITGRGGFRDT
jgi:uncharacterized phage protein gp47/JayE